MKTVNLTDIDLIKFVGNQESQFLQTKDAWTDEVVELFENGETLKGSCLPWQKTFDQVRLRPAEVSIWAGINGHKKSMMTGMVAAWLSQDEKILIASLEMMPRKTLERMVKQVSGCEKPSAEYIEWFLREDTDNLWIYDQQDSVEPERVLGLVWYAGSELQVKHIFIDSLAKCGIAPDDYKGQKNFIDRLAWAAKATGIHVHLVHHIRKDDTEHKRPGKFDVKGAGELTDLVDNVFIVWANKAKASKEAAGEEIEEAEPDQALIVAKQRNGEFEGNINLWFHSPSLQFVSAPGYSPLRWPTTGDSFEQRDSISYEYSTGV